MSNLLALLISFIFLLSKPTINLANQEQEGEEFLKNCPPSTCGSGSKSLQIRFPLRLRPAPPACGLPGLDLTCSGNDTLLSLLPSLPPFKVTAIDYQQTYLTIRIGSGFGSLSSSCPLRNLSTFTFLQTPTYSVTTANAIVVNCTERFDPGSDPSRQVVGPIPCLSGSGYFVYVVYEYARMDGIPHGCVVSRSGVEIPYAGASYNFGESVDVFVKWREVSLFWSGYWDSWNLCRDCEKQGSFCGLNWVSNQTFCYKPPYHHHGLRVELIIGASIGGLLIVATVAFIFFYISRRSEKEKETRMKVERFLATYKTDKPTRYTYSGIKKITKRFRHKLGQGGFGSVYRGELLNGIPVAVKMLERSEADVQEFVNEVATMGRIHHVNIVRLFGFCSEGTRQALIYEYMPNESLEKFIFSKEARTDQRFSIEKLQDIAVGIALGIEYLHQGCDERILHFDIKPHNILLDHNFNPKISDFGLAKLCSRDQSIVTLTAARGTMGYIAPEIYSRNFGTVSYKSDVYSFGMLLLEMVSGRRNIDPEIDNVDEVYFPELIYNRLVHGEDLGLAAEQGKEEDIVKKLVIVALWCIQWSPTDRPTMSRVVQLLVGELDACKIPPKPFVSSSDQDDETSVLVLVDKLKLN